jgi:hypothetical protein
MITDKQLKEVEKYTNKIFKLRALLGDQTTPAQLIPRPAKHGRAAWKRRKEELRRLELARERYVLEITVG